MGIVLEIGISNYAKGEMTNVKNVFVEAGNGIIDDRYYNKENQKFNQITLIESEKIDFYNGLINLNIPYINFRRNIITKGINLSSLLNSEFYIGNVKIKANELCQPCKRLQDELKQTNFVKEMYNKSGLRGQILTNGKILVGDKIKY